MFDGSSSLAERLRAFTAALEPAPPPPACAGRVEAARGLGLTLGDAAGLAIGDRFGVPTRAGGTILAEVVGIEDGTIHAMAFAPLEHVEPQAMIVAAGTAPGLLPHAGWLGRVLDPAGAPLDGGPPPPQGWRRRRLDADPPPAGLRARLGPRLPLMVRALDAFAPCRVGQRLGLFAAAGVGKSSLLAMLARNAACDVAVIALVGERGRELREFIEDDLGPAGLARSVILCATSDQSPLLRRDAALAAMTVAEHFRDHGARVLLLMDSVTRYAQALREIGLAAGELPVARGFPPSVFSALPRLLERAGPGTAGQGSITGFFTVLTEGDDPQDPVADTVRGILDGHVLLDRRIAEAGRYPAVDVLRSLSRTAPGVLTQAERPVAAEARRVLARWEDVADLVRVGAWKAGMEAETDRAVRLAPLLQQALVQAREAAVPPERTFAELADLLAQAPLPADAA